MTLQRFFLWSTLVMLAAASVVVGQPHAGEKAGKEQPKIDDKKKDPKIEEIKFPSIPTILDKESRPIDLAAALQLAGVQNPEILLARERIIEAAALRQLAAAQFLPSINAGTNLNHHNGTLQQSNGNMLKVNRDSLYLGLGASAVGAGTVNIPGIVWSGNVSTTIYQSLVSRQVVRQREFASQATQNEVLLRVAQTYLELLRAEGRRAIAAKNKAEALEVARITANFAAKGQGRQADADRAATELEQRNNDLLQAEADTLTASARLCQLLGLNPSERLHPVDGWVVPHPIVPEPIPVPELITIALTQRPELRERQAAIRAALLELQNAKVLPFSPNVILGYSAGGFGGGSDLATEGTPMQPRFTNLKDRQDFDVVVFWSLRNLGVGNAAMIRLAQSNVRQNEFRNVEVLDRVRAEVVLAYARTHVRYAQIETNERAVQASSKAYEQDYERTKNGQGLPIEVLDSLRLLSRSRYSYLDAIIDYNRAHFDLYVALGQPPANTLARPVPSKLVPAPSPAVAPQK
jgi:outer membrane protein TolC